MNEQEQQELSDRFRHHPPVNDEVADTHDTIRTIMENAALAIFDLTPPSREASLAQTALQEAAMWANAAVAIHLNKIELENMGSDNPS